MHFTLKHLGKYRKREPNASHSKALKFRQKPGTAGAGHALLSVWELLHSTFRDRSIPDGCSLDLNCYPNEMCHIAPNLRYLVGRKQDFLGFPAPVQLSGLSVGLQHIPG